MSAVRAPLNEPWPIVDQEEPNHVRVAVRQILNHAWNRRQTSRDRVTLRPGFLTAARLYATALHHPLASPELRLTLFKHAVSCVHITPCKESA